ncbi:putative transcription factor B3-Domain family [Helianthus anomalus]
MYYLMGGWLKFMNKNHLQLGDLLVFWLRSFDPKPMFEVIIYSLNGCLKNTSSSDDTCLDHKKKPSVEEAISDRVSLKNVEEPLKLPRVVRKDTYTEWMFFKFVCLQDVLCVDDDGDNICRESCLYVCIYVKRVVCMCVYIYIYIYKTDLGY